jgi:hypothetical protein
LLAIAFLLLIASACNKNETRAAASPDPASPAGDVARTAPPAAEPAPTAVKPAGAEQAPAAQAQTPAPGEADAGAETVDPSSLVGQFGFDASTEKRVKCKKVDAKMAAMLSSKGAHCTHPPEGNSFGEGAGKWTNCELGQTQWVVYATAKICKDQLETMEANGD